MEDLICICGHSEEEHYGEPMGDESPKISCQAGTDDGGLCWCDDFTDPGEPIDAPEPERLVEAIKQFETKKSFSSAKVFASRAVAVIETRRPLKRTKYSFIRL